MFPFLVHPHVRDVKHDHSDITAMCLHFHMDWCIIHPVDGVVKVAFSDVDVHLQHGQHTR